MQSENSSKSELQKKSNGLGVLFASLVALHILASVALSLLVNGGVSVPVWIQLLISELTIMVPAVIYILKENLSFRNDLGFRPIKVGTIFMTLLAAILFYPLVALVNLISQLFVSNTALEMSDAFMSLQPVVLVFIGGFFGPFCEEFVFRSIINNGMRKLTSVMAAGCASGLLFGLLHMNFNQFCYAFVMGVAFALINEVSGSVYTSMILHTAYNTVNLITFVAEAKLMETVNMDVLEQAEKVRNSDIMYYAIGAFLIVSIVCLALLIPVIGWIGKHEGRSEVFRNLLKKPEEKVRILLTVGMVIGMALCLAMMFIPEGFISRYMSK